ncbi:hypothetical protein JTE90_027448 [Oedothorax gibbosus]|uniref:RNA transcription, translation and transport factor protein n=1 Tax=Oedothorax gibbosus TaxID=931172 RepID=A0AAV6VZC6_9ARAC|nr:hypothetical protein JTE90_027448 [Oedothorax gibbosus]
MAYNLKLKALGYMKIEDFNVYSDEDFRSLVVWLEDQVIRHYPIEERTPLRKVKSPDWENALLEYLNQLACPYSDREEVTDWLLGLAVKLEYNDNIELYKNVKAEEVKSSAPQVVSSNPLDNIDFESDEFKGCVKALANRLKIVQHPDHLVTLSACCKIIRTYFSKEALANKENVKKNCNASALLDMPLGFTTNDPVLDKAAKILRLCFINDLRKLQTQVNETIVQIQNITANPKTDTRLGKVGR